MGSSNTSGLMNVANQLGGEQSKLFNDVLGVLGGMGSETGGLTSLYPGLGNLFSGLLSGGGSQLPGIFQQLESLSSSPGALAKFTGVNAPGLVQGATGYLGNPGATNLAAFTPGAMTQLGAGNSALNLAGPQAMSFFRNEMNTGLNPQFATNAQNQLQQQFQTALNTAQGNLAPGQNAGAVTEDLTNSLLTGSANLGAQLAGESQQIEGQGAQGLTSTAQSMDVNNLQRIMSQAQLAGGLDEQKMNMLLQAAQLGTGYNQQQLANVGGGLNAGMGVLGGAQNLAGVGLGAQEFGAGQLSGMGSELGTEGFDYAQLAAQLQAMQPSTLSTIAQLLGSGVNMYSTIAGLPGKGGGGGAGGGGGGGYSPVM